MRFDEEQQGIAEAARKVAERVAEEARIAEARARRRQKELEAQRRTEAVARQMRQEQRVKAQKRLAEQARALAERRKQAEKRSREVAEKARQRQQQAAKDRLAKITAEEEAAAVEEREENSASNVANMESEQPSTPQFMHGEAPQSVFLMCAHMSTISWWPRKRTGGSMKYCSFCREKCMIFYWNHPHCAPVVCRQCRSDIIRSWSKGVGLFLGNHGQK